MVHRHSKKDISHTTKSRKWIVTQKGINYAKYHHIGSVVLPSIPSSINWKANPSPTYISLIKLIIPQLPQREAIMDSSPPHPFLPSLHDGDPSATPPSQDHLRKYQ